MKLQVPSKKRRNRFQKVHALDRGSAWPMRALLFALLGVVASGWALHRHLTHEKPALLRPAPTETPAPEIEVE